MKVAYAKENEEIDSGTAGAYHEIHTLRDSTLSVCSYCSTPTLDVLEKQATTNSAADSQLDRSDNPWQFSAEVRELILQPVRAAGVDRHIARRRTVRYDFERPHHGPVNAVSFCRQSTITDGGAFGRFHAEIA